MGGNSMWQTNSRRELLYVIALFTRLLKGYESSQSIFLHCYLSTFMTLPKPKNHSIFLNYSY